MTGKIIDDDVTDETAKPKKLREWGAKAQSDVVEIKSRFGDKILTTKAIFNSKTPADIAAYSVIKNRVSLVEKDLEDSAIKIPASMRRKAELFDRINPRVEGYAGRVPVHHKAAFVTGFFEPKISSVGKK